MVRESDASRDVWDECFKRRWDLLRSQATPDGFRASWEAWKNEVKETCERTFVDFASPWEIETAVGFLRLDREGTFS
jgi:hypothetical protein